MKAASFFRRELLVACSLALLLGCGGGKKQDMERFATSAPEVMQANAMRGLIAGLEQQLKAEGPRGLISELGTIDEALEQFQGDSVGAANRPIYDQLATKLKELAASATSDPAGITAKLQELKDLADTLPKDDSAPAAGT